MLRKADDSEKFAGLAFKIMTDPFVGSLTFVRIYSGTLNSGSYVQNTVKDNRERVGRMLLMHANSREDVKEAFAGDIVALAGLKNTTTGDTICDVDHQVILERMEFPEPVIELAIEPKTKADQEKMGMALGRLVSEGSLFYVFPPTKKPARPRLKRAWANCIWKSSSTACAANSKWKQTSVRRRCEHRETRSPKKFQEDYATHKQSGGSGQFARVIIDFEPLPPGSGFVFETKIVGGTVPREYIPGVEKGLEASLGNGVVAGFPMIDFKATLVDGAYHDVDSSALAFEIAARAAFREGLPKAGPVLLGRS